MTTYDSVATRARILDTATEEFAARGLAGARVDRIAAAAPANKKQIYVHFGSKEGLFDVVVADAVERLISQVPITTASLGDYAANTYQALTEDPRVFRLAMWRQLERPILIPQEYAQYRAKAEALLADRPELPFPPTHVLSVLLAIAQGWLIASPALEDLDDSTAGQRRELIRRSVDAVFGIDGE